MSASLVALATAECNLLTAFPSQHVLSPAGLMRQATDVVLVEQAVHFSDEVEDVGIADGLVVLQRVILG